MADVVEPDTNSLQIPGETHIQYCTVYASLLWKPGQNDSLLLSVIFWSANTLTFPCPSPTWEYSPHQIPVTFQLFQSIKCMKNKVLSAFVQIDEFQWSTCCAFSMIKHVFNEILIVSYHCVSLHFSSSFSINSQVIIYQPLHRLPQLEMTAASHPSHPHPHR